MATHLRLNAAVSGLLWDRLCFSASKPNRICRRQIAVAEIGTAYAPLELGSAKTQLDALCYPSPDSSFHSPFLAAPALDTDLEPPGIGAA